MVYILRFIYFRTSAGRRVYHFPIYQKDHMCVACLNNRLPILLTISRIDDLPHLGSIRVGRFDVSEVVCGVVSDVVSEVVSENCWHQKRGKKQPWIYSAGETTSETRQKLLWRSFYIVSEVFLVSPTL
jgi:hypothetical protein